MVSIELMDKKNNTLIHSTRPALVPYKSPLLQSIHTLFYSLFYLSGKLESSTITIDLVHNFVERGSNSIAFAKVSLSNPFIQTYKTSLLIQTHFQGLAYFMHHWWLSTGLFFIASIMLIEILIVAIFVSFLSDSMGEQVEVEAPESSVQSRPEATVEKSETQEFGTDDKEDIETLDGFDDHRDEQVQPNIEPQVLTGMLRNAAAKSTSPLGGFAVSRTALNRQVAPTSGSFSYPYSQTNYRSDNTSRTVPDRVVQLANSLPPSPSRDNAVPDVTMESMSLLQNTQVDDPNSPLLNISASTIQLEDSTIMPGDDLDYEDEFDMEGLLKDHNIN